MFVQLMIKTGHSTGRPSFCFRGNFMSRVHQRSFPTRYYEFQNVSFCRRANSSEYLRSRSHESMTTWRPKGAQCTLWLQSRLTIRESRAEAARPALSSDELIRLSRTSIAGEMRSWQL